MIRPQPLLIIRIPIEHHRQHPPDTGRGHRADHGLHPVRGLRRAVADGCPHGLRYIDVVRASGGKDFRFYLRPGLHGVGDEVFQPGQHLLRTESRSRTVVGVDTGTMVVRIVQNDQGSSLPPDLMDAAQ